MRYLLFSIIIFPSLALAEKNMHGFHADHNAHHGPHVAMDYVDGTSTELDVPRFDEFVSDQVGNQIAVVSVTGMVCDFCARGIEKISSKKTRALKRSTLIWILERC